MSALLIGTSGDSMQSKLFSLVQGPKPEITFKLQSSKKTYTTLDRIEGVLNVVAPVDTSFDGVEIEFCGTSRTFVERMTTAAAASGRSEAFHQFLKLSQPGLEEFYPSDLVLRAGQVYQFPFVFAVPEQLLPRVCKHAVKHEAVRHAHLRLPPTFGDRELGARSAENMDDLAPEMASIRYGIFAKVTELKEHKGELHASTLASKARRIRVIPQAEEQPPLDVHEEDGEYLMRKERAVRKNLFKSKTGTLTMEAAQPSALKVRSYNNPESKTTSSAAVVLRFDPSSADSPLPRLGTMTTKFKLSTFFASTARTGIPTKNSAMLDLASGVHSEQFTLSQRCMANVEWTRHEPGQSAAIVRERRDSGNSMSSGDIPSPSKSYQGGVFYTARLVVPIELPSDKNFVPTFHSCLVGRHYQIKLDLGIASAGLSLSSMELKLPVQVTTDKMITEESLQRRSSADSGISLDADVEAEDVSSFFEPRMMRVGSESVAGRSRIGSLAPPNDALPGYTAVTGFARAGGPYEGRRTMSVPAY